MKNINILLNETTIINFPFIWKLLKRYLIVTLLTPVVGIVLGVYFFMIQNDIYMVSRTFKYVSDDSSSPTNAIAVLLGEKTTTLTPAEIVSIVQSEDFHQKLAEVIYSHKEFKQLNFNSIYSKNNKSFDEFYSDCSGDKKCIIDKLRSSFSEFYGIKSKEMVRTQYELNVKSLDRLTSEILLEEVKKIIVEMRIQDTKHFISEQINISEKLIKNKKDSMKNISLNDFNERIISVSKELEDLNYRIRYFHTFYNTNKGALYEVKEKYIQNQKVLKRGVSSVKMDNYKKQLRLKDERINVQKNINELESVLGTLSQDERYILKELKVKRTKLDFEIKKLQTSTSSRTIGTIQKFLKSKGRSSDFDEFNYKVQSKRFKKIDSEYKSFIKKRKKLEKELAFFQGKLEELRPSFEYLKLLESKLIQLKLVESTVVSDLIFDDYNPLYKKYKRTSKGKIIIFSSLIASFFLFLYIILRYIFDPRIYDEYELSKNFSNLKIIGNTPDFS